MERTKPLPKDIKLSIETPEAPKSPEEEKKERVASILALVAEIQEQHETLSFPGLEAGIYESMKSDDEEFPGYTTPIDEILQRFEQEGMKVVLGKNPGSGNVFALPAGSDDITMDSILVYKLKVSADMDEKLRQLVELTGRR